MGYLGNAPADQAVQIGDGVVDTDQLAADAVENAKIADNAVDTEHLADNAADTAEIADNAVTLAKMDGLARGKMIIGDSSGDPSALAAGTNGQVLKMDGSGDIVWGTDSGGAALTGSTNNTVTTVTGSDAIAGEANLLFETVNSTAPVLSIGVAPDVAAKDWKSTQSALQIGGALTLSTTSDPDEDGDNLVVISNNTYYDHADDRWNHIATDDKGMQLRMYDGKFEFRTSGNKRDTGDEFTDGAVFQVSDSGNLSMVGTETPIFSISNPERRYEWYVAGAASDQLVWKDGTADATRMTLDTSGVISGDFNDTSDEALKTNIIAIPAGLSIVNALNPVTFDWDSDVTVRSGSNSGFIAQEVETVLPNDVSGDDYDEDDAASGKAINVTGIVAHLTKAIQELSAKVEALENE